jgi:hypothetical protein
MRQVTGWSIAVAGALAMLATSSAIAQTPKKGGTLNFAVVAEPPNYDCHGSTAFALIHPIAPHYSLLVKFDGKEYPKVVGDLAESAHRSPSVVAAHYRQPQEDQRLEHDAQPLSGSGPRPGLARRIGSDSGLAAEDTKPIA